MREAFARLEATLAGAVTLSPAQQAAQAVLDGPARYCALVGGTRSGKTFLIVRAIVQRALAFPNSRHAMLRFRANAARASLALDTLPNVVRRCFPHTHAEEHRQDGFFQFPNGSEVWFGGLDDKDRVEKILGQEHATIFLNEASQIPYASAVVALTRLAQSVLGLTQKAFVDLNPGSATHWTNRLFGEKRDPVTKLPLKNPEAYARAFLNPEDNRENLSPEYMESLKHLPTRQRLRFYEGRYVDEVEGALWTPDTIERCRVSTSDLPDMKRLVIGVDPAVSTNSDSAETGIVAVGLGVDGKGYILADASGKYSPTQWARKVISLYNAMNADRVIAEQNQGGALVENTIKAVDPTVAYKGVHASRGKIARAEPVAVLFEQGKIFIAGEGFPELEEQMANYVPGGESPDRLDAMVWAATELMVKRVPLQVSIPAPCQVGAGPMNYGNIFGGDTRAPHLSHGSEYLPRIG